MTIEEMIANGSELQGDDIYLKIWSHSEERYIFDKNLNDVPAGSPEICERPVKYIYTEKGKLVIELESED